MGQIVERLRNTHLSEEKDGISPPACGYEMFGLSGKCFHSQDPVTPKLFGLQGAEEV